MRVEIGRPLERQQELEKDDLPPVAGVGHRDASFNPLEQWKERQAAKVIPQSQRGHVMPGVEAMPDWESFVGWAAPKVAAAPVAVVQKTAPEPPKETANSETTLEVSQLNLSQIVDEPALEESEPARETLDSLETTLDLGDVAAAQPSADPTLDLGDLKLQNIIRAAADSVPEPELVMPQTQAASPMPALGLSPKLASVSPLAHPGRLPKGFALSDVEKMVLRACDGRRTTQAIHEAGFGLNAAQLSGFLKRCAQVKLVTFKSVKR